MLKLMSESLGEAGALLKGWRARRGLTQFEAAARAGVSTRHLSFLEAGRARGGVAVLDRLCRALDLDGAERDSLRLASGHAPVASVRGTGLFAAVAALEEADDVATLVARSRAILASLGICQFFLGAAAMSSAGRAMRWFNPGTFPNHWLTRYDRAGYAGTDPLLAAAERSGRGFFWSEATATGPLVPPARRMFAEAAAEGILSGFVVPLHGPGSSVAFVSLMSRDPERRDARSRLALQTVGLQMLFGVERRSALPGW